MAKHLTSSDVEAVVGIIDAWRGETLTWEAICEAAEGPVGKRPSRQSLFHNERVKAAYTARKNRLREAPRDPLPANLKMASQRIRRLEAENASLKESYAAVLALNKQLSYNGYKYGLSKQQMTAPLPKIDRERTEDD
jgi:hypothetical protein